MDVLYEFMKKTSLSEKYSLIGCVCYSIVVFSLLA